MSTKVTFEFPDDVHTALKIIAAERKTTMRALVLECVKKLVSERITLPPKEP